MAEPGVSVLTLTRCAWSLGFHPGARCPRGRDAGVAWGCGISLATRRSDNGATREAVCGLEAVPSTSDLARWGGCPAEGTGGYQFGKSVVGPEGTLLIATQVALELVALVCPRAGWRPPLAKFRDAGSAGVNIVGVPLLPSSPELMSATSMEAVNMAMGVGSSQADKISFIEVNGDNLEADREKPVKATEEYAPPRDWARGGMSSRGHASSMLFASGGCARRAVCTSGPRSLRQCVPGASVVWLPSPVGQWVSNGEPVTIC